MQYALQQNHDTLCMHGLTLTDRRLISDSFLQA